MNFKILRSQFLIATGLITMFCITFFEIPPALRNFYFKNILKYGNAICKDINIKNINFEIGSCPNTKYFRAADPYDKKISFTVTYTDSIGGRVDKLSKGKVFKNEDYKLYLIGDSFIQADEIPYEDTVYGLINKYQNKKDFKAYGFGFAGWHTKEYLQSIKAINAYKSRYDVFLYSNEFTPNDHRPRINRDGLEISSNLKETENKEKKKIRSTGKYVKDFLNFLANKTFTFKRLRYIYFSKKFENKYKDDNFFTVFENNSNKNCSIKKDYKNKVPLFMYDYLVLSLPFNCWEKIHKDTYKLVLNDMRMMINEARIRDSQVRFIYIPIGFGFKGEFNPGRYYINNFGSGVPKDKELNLTGLTDQLKSDLGSLFINLEQPFRFAINNKKLEKNCELDNCDNIFYFGYDGHLNKSGHLFLYEHLYKDPR